MAEHSAESPEPVAHLFRTGTQNDLGLIDLGGPVSEGLRAKLGDTPPYEEILDSVWLQPLLGAATTATSLKPALDAGHIFIATAHPSALMRIGGGFSTAVRSKATGQILHHAPFRLVSTSLTPVIGPILAFVTLSSMLTSAGLKRVQQTLEEISRDRKAEDVGKLSGADDRLQDAASQLGRGRTLSNPTTNTLTSDRTTIQDLNKKYELKIPWSDLEGERPLDRKRMASTLRDIDVFAASTLLRLKADYLWYLAHQEDQERADELQVQLLQDVEACRSRFEPMETRLEELNRPVDKAGLVRRSIDLAAEGAHRTGWTPKARQRRNLELVLDLPFVKECLRRQESATESLVLVPAGGKAGALKAYRTHDLELVQAEATRSDGDDNAKATGELQGTAPESASSPIIQAPKEVDVVGPTVQPAPESAGGAAGHQRLEGDVSELKEAVGLLHQETAALGGRLDGLGDEVTTRLDASDERAKEDLAEFRGEVQSGFAALGDGFRDESSALREKLDGVDTRLEEVDARVEKVAQNVLRLRSEAKVRAQESRRQLKALLWLAGIGLALGAGAVVWLVFILGAVNA